MNTDRESRLRALQPGDIVRSIYDARELRVVAAPCTRFNGRVMVDCVWAHSRAKRPTAKPWDLADIDVPVTP